MIRHFNYLRGATASLSLVGLLATGVAGCSKDNEIDQSTNVSNGCSTPATDLAKLCPPGTSVDITGTTAVGDGACPAGEGEVKDSQGNTTGVCRTFSGCSVRCKATCECGVKSASTTSVECAPCATCTPGEASCSGNKLLLCGPDGKQVPTDCQAQGQVCSASLGQCVAANKCGNGVCEANEDETSCAVDCKKACGDGVCSGVETAASCPEDCVQVVCGNGKCEQDEQKTCPQDCGGSVCVPNARECIGTRLLVCQPDGAKQNEYDCGAFGQSCSGGGCVKPDECGNGLCEASDPSGCVDCVSKCGDGFCADSESFASCSQDCPPVCGDGACQGEETGATCAQDCLPSCGSNGCEAAQGETRDNCPKDCGFCGDGVCDEAFESPLLSPKPGKESCLIDCVKSTGCKSATDCDDSIACTTDTCGANGVCAYSPGDCGGSQVCLPYQGCCEDKDGDGFASVSCGGEDCFDDAQDPDAALYGGLSPSQVRPGMAEFCDGIDRNCNKQNLPSIQPPVQLTSDVSDKGNLQIDSSGSSYLFAWKGSSGGTPSILYTLADASLKLLDGGTPKPVTTDAKFAPNDRLAVIYSPTKKGYAVAWDQHPKTFFTWINGSGAVEPKVPVQGSASDNNAHTRLRISQANGSYLVLGTTELGTFPIFTDAGVALESTPQTTNPQPPLYGLTSDGTKHILLGRWNFLGDGLMTVDASGNLGPVVSIGSPTSTVTTENIPDISHQIAWDGDGVLVLHRDYKTQKLTYSRASFDGKITPSVELASAAFAPLDIRYDAPSKTIAILALSNTSVHFGVLRLDGSVVLPLGAIASGEGVSVARIFQSNGTYRVFYNAKDKNGIHQVFSAAIACQ